MTPLHLIHLPLARLRILTKIVVLVGAAFSICSPIHAQEMVPFAEAFMPPKNTTVNLQDLSSQAQAQYQARVAQTNAVDALDQTDMSMVFFKQDSSGNVTFLTNQATLSSGTYQVVFYWVKYMAVNIQNRIIYYGVGGQATGSYTVNKKGIIASLEAVALNASGEADSGSIHAHLVGLSGAPIDNIILPTSSDVTDTTISAYMVQFATIFAKDHDPGVYVVPSIVGFDKQTAIDLGIISK